MQSFSNLIQQKHNLLNNINLTFGNITVFSFNPPSLLDVTPRLQSLVRIPNV